MASEGPGGSELAQLVADHFFSDIDRHMLSAVVDGNRVADHFREDGRGADQVLMTFFSFFSFIASILLHQRFLNEIAFFDRSAHLRKPPFDYSCSFS